MEKLKSWELEGFWVKEKKKKHDRIYKKNVGSLDVVFSPLVWFLVIEIMTIKNKLIKQNPKKSSTTRDF